MRRIEVLRLKLGSLRTGRIPTINVHGRGRHGGKHRAMSWGNDTPGDIEAYLRIRDAIIAKAMAVNPAVDVPEELLTYERNGRLFPYKKSAIENLLKRLSKRVGIEFSNHTLVGTCGRMMWRAKVPIETIAGIFCHSDTNTTML